MAWGPASYGSPSPKKKTVSASKSSGYDPGGFSYTTQPRDTSKPSFLSSMGGGNKPSGPNIVVKPKPSIPQPTYNFNKGQVGGISSIPSYAKQPYYTNLEAVRDEYFDNRSDVSRDRLFRRSEQDRLYQNFKNTMMKPVLTADGKPTGMYQSVTPGGPTLSDEANRLANIYGPTPKELMSDIVYGAKNLFGGIAKIPGQLMQAYQQFSPLGNILSKVQEFGGKVFNPYDISGKLQMAGPEAQRVYAMYMQQGMPYQQAYELATGQKLMFNGGIASLN